VAELCGSVLVGLAALPATVDPGDGWVARAAGRRGTVMESHVVSDLVTTLVAQIG
jgi:hypothetical protein